MTRMRRPIIHVVVSQRSCWLLSVAGSRKGLRMSVNACAGIFPICAKNAAISWHRASTMAIAAIGRVEHGRCEHLP